ncbi:hypothetical protein RHMOL_Rhmol01G0166200 [Rhododendron molle]|uniref:Uncharacterized protein n=1 Tax=Rhododendron molle TaxID=49168 RepID=A0ACC0Q1V6_RHOML|nr:hypothetical protein RHMOL_Rhmol01G0166200 [Rhododendron molle]
MGVGEENYTRETGRRRSITSFILYLAAPAPEPNPASEPVLIPPVPPLESFPEFLIPPPPEPIEPEPQGEPAENPIDPAENPLGGVGNSIKLDEDPDESEEDPEDDSKEDPKEWGDASSVGQLRGRLVVVMTRLCVD